jgi:hypothetical protein
MDDGTTVCCFDPMQVHKDMVTVVGLPYKSEPLPLYESNWMSLMNGVQRFIRSGARDQEPNTSVVVSLQK